jgi:hypothetical protein
MRVDQPPQLAPVGARRGHRRQPLLAGRAVGGRQHQQPLVAHARRRATERQAGAPHVGLQSVGGGGGGRGPAGSRAPVMPSAMGCAAACLQAGPLPGRPRARTSSGSSRSGGSSNDGAARRRAPPGGTSSSSTSARSTAGAGAGRPGSDAAPPRGAARPRPRPWPRTAPPRPRPALRPAPPAGCWSGAPAAAGGGARRRRAAGWRPRHRGGGHAAAALRAGRHAARMPARPRAGAPPAPAGARAASGGTRRAASPHAAPAAAAAASFHRRLSPGFRAPASARATTPQIAVNDGRARVKGSVSTVKGARIGGATRRRTFSPGAAWSAPSSRPPPPPRR